jgi:S-adenosylmethionine:tRNA ribosyltransferase-isomerase
MAMPPHSSSTRELLVYCLDQYHYELPEALIAQQPVEQRDRSRLLQLQRVSGEIAHGRFADLAGLLTSGDVLVLNNTRVVPGRLLGHKESGGQVEVLILDFSEGVARNRFECMVRASKRPKPGANLLFGGGLQARVEALNGSTSVLSFSGPAPLEQALESIGHVPLPPYIRRKDTDRDHDNYQTVYARHKGAIAAPTAGLHFTRELLQRLADKGVAIVYLTLHVGYGTFVPVRVTDIREHRMHAEWFSLSREAADTIVNAKQGGGRVVAVGTTCVRTLEYCAPQPGKIEARSGMCDLYIYPGYRFNIVDAMITNFHLPQSTLLMLVSAFAGRKNVLNAYAQAVKEKYRFYSYGDAMLIS